MKPTLLVLAAGMSSRYGSLKQMDGVGPNGETIHDYSVYDAIRGGFGKVVFIIRESFADEFKSIFNEERYGDKIKVEYVYQELDKLPEGFALPEGRERPWGTNHAILVAKDLVHENFAVINADDFYGEDAIATMGRYLTETAGKRGIYAMVAYDIERTLSENGTVNRGVCEVDADGNLTKIVERLQIARQADGRITHQEDGEHKEIANDTVVSMNLFGFTPDYMDYSEQLFMDFLNDKANVENLRSEIYIASVVNKLINEGKATMKALSTTSNWFGVTYAEDRPETQAKIKELVDKGRYPSNMVK